MFQYLYLFDTIQRAVEMFEVESLSVRRQVLEQAYLWSLVRGRVDDAGCLGLISYRVPGHNSRNKCLFDLPYSRTASRAAFPLLRMMRLYNTMVSKRSDIDIHNDSLKGFKKKVVPLLTY